MAAYSVNQSLGAAIPDILYDAAGYEARAEECVRLANLTEDVLIREQILSLRQNYLGVARRLREREEAANRDPPDGGRLH